MRTFVIVGEILMLLLTVAHTSSSTALSNSQITQSLGFFNYGTAFTGGIFETSSGESFYVDSVKGNGIYEFEYFGDHYLVSILGIVLIMGAGITAVLSDKEAKNPPILLMVLILLLIIRFIFLDYRNLFFNKRCDGFFGQ
ncbi:MAG: hypothetical protein IH840_09175 [Candidatus Heimdallarchaeota archaeon]|nr:hypothetical protein [Candidatus Heimdallarchaeota archaeon]